MSNTTKPKFFYCYLDNEIVLNHLSDEQAGKLWKMLFDYTNNDVKADTFDTLVAMAFDVMAQQIDRDFKKYQDKCEKNRQDRAKANDRQRSSTTVSVRDQEEEKEEEKEEDKDKEKEEDKEEEKEDNIVEQDSTVYFFDIFEIIEYIRNKLGTNCRLSTKAVRRQICPLDMFQVYQKLKFQLHSDGVMCFITSVKSLHKKLIIGLISSVGCKKSGTIIAVISAEYADFMPFMLSSRAIQLSGSTPNFSEAFKNTSG